MDIRYILLICVFLLLGQYILNLNKSRELFTNKDIDSLFDEEKERKMFCKMLRNTKNKSQYNRFLETSNRKLNNQWKEQNELIKNIKNKIINIKLDRDELDFMKFNTNKNKKNISNMRRKIIINQAKKNLIQPNKFNISIKNKLSNK